MYKSQLKVCGYLNEKLYSKKKGNKRQHHYNFFYRCFIDQNLSPRIAKETLCLTFLVNNHHSSTTRSHAPDEVKEMFSQNSMTYTYNRLFCFFFYFFILRGHLKTKPISSVSCTTVRVGIR